MFSPLFQLIIHNDLEALKNWDDLNELTKLHPVQHGHTTTGFHIAVGMSTTNLVFCKLYLQRCLELANAPTTGQNPEGPLEEKFDLHDERIIALLEPIINKTASNGQTALHTAIRRTAYSSELCDFLINTLGHITNLSLETREKLTPFGLAIKYHRNDVADHLTRKNIGTLSGSAVVQGLMFCPASVTAILKHQCNPPITAHDLNYFISSISNSRVYAIAFAFTNEGIRGGTYLRVNEKKNATKLIYAMALVQGFVLSLNTTDGKLTPPEQEPKNQPENFLLPDAGSAHNKNLLPLAISCHANLTQIKTLALLAQQAQKIALVDDEFVIATAENQVVQFTLAAMPDIYDVNGKDENNTTPLELSIEQYLDLKKWDRTTLDEQEQQELTEKINEKLQIIQFFFTDTAHYINLDVHTKLKDLCAQDEHLQQLYSDYATKFNADKAAMAIPSLKELAFQQCEKLDRATCKNNVDFFKEAAGSLEVNGFFSMQRFSKIKDFILELAKPTNSQESSETSQQMRNTQ